MNAAPQFVRVLYDTTILGAGQNAQGNIFPGGLDLTTPSLSLQKGALVDAVNFEAASSGGYARIQGYERVDGRASPSGAVYTILQMASLTNVPAVGQVVTQSTGTIIAPGSAAVIITGSTAASSFYTVENAAGVSVQGTLTVSGGAITASGTVAVVVQGSTPYLVLTAVSGVFNTTDSVTASGSVTIGVPVSQTISISAQQGAIYTAAAADVLRALIGPVPGIGALLGVVAIVFNGVDRVFAFRANPAGTGVSLYQGSASGWVLVPFFNTINFIAGGATTPQDGDTLTQGGATATIKRVMTQAGAWTGTAAGNFVITNPTGGTFIPGAATTSGGATLTVTAGITPITLATGGRFEFVKANFAGQLITRRIYGCDGINKAFEFDGVTLAPITTGLVPDMPSHIAFHKNFLFIAQASSLSYCGAGTPFRWSSVDGGGEIATGDTVTGMVSMPGSQTSATMAVFMASNTAFLYGTDPTTFNFVPFPTSYGAIQYTAQNLSDTFAFDNFGVYSIKTTLNYGNFLPSSLNRNILPFIARERSKVTASTISRTKGQYRVFFSDGYGLWATVVNQQYLGSMPVLFPNPVFCCDEDKNTAGTEVIYFGSSDGLGYVYQMDVGTSFDGSPIAAHITTAWNPMGASRVLKRFRAASIEVQGSAYAEFSYGYLLGYGTPLIGQPPIAAPTALFSTTPQWDSFIWDSFVWDGVTLLPSDVDEVGTAENIQVTVSTGGNYVASFTLNSIIHHYSMRRGIRV